MVPESGSITSSAVAAVRDARKRLRRIETVTDVALSKLTLEELLDELLTRMREVLEVDTAAVLLLDDSGDFLTPVAAKGLEEEVIQAARIPVGSGFAGRVAATAAPVVLGNVNPSNVVNPILIRKHLSSVAGVPLLDGEEVIGVMHVGTFHPYEFTEDDISVLTLAADRVAGAINNRRAYIERAAAASLQRSLAPHRFPDVPGFEFAARYSPGTQFGVSGDWYDAFHLPGNRVGVVIGDVMGHGLWAATVMGRLKSALRAYSLDHDEPATVIHHLDRKIQHFEPGQMATVVFGVLSPESGHFTFSSAGHLPVAFRTPDGETRLLTGGTGLPLGVEVDRPRQDHVITLDEGAELCLFTDGLFDQHEADIDVSLGQLADILSARWPTADMACAELMAGLVGQRQVEDDATLVILRRKAGDSGGKSSSELRT